LGTLLVSSDLDLGAPLLGAGLPGEPLAGSPKYTPPVGHIFPLVAENYIVPLTPGGLPEST
jgi:hypothetical protein